MGSHYAERLHNLSDSNTSMIVLAVWWGGGGGWGSFPRIDPNTGNIYTSIYIYIRIYVYMQRDTFWREEGTLRVILVCNCALFRPKINCVFFSQVYFDELKIAVWKRCPICEDINS